MGWYYRMAGTTQGPIERDGLVELLRRGTLTPQVEVSEDEGEWAMAPMVPGLMEEVFSKPSGGSAAPASSPPAPTPKPQPTPASPQPPSPARAAMSSDLPGPESFSPSQRVIPATEAEQETRELPEPGETEAPASSAGRDEPELEIKAPSGPVGHIVFDPEARRRKASKRQGTGFFKTAACGLFGLAVMVAIGLFAANKVFGIDLRPAVVDESVSRFMIEKPEIVARLDIDTILKSKAMRRIGLDSNPKLPYINDAEDVILASDSLDLTSPRFLAIIKLKRDYRSEFIANLFRSGTTSAIGAFQMHSDPGGIGGLPIAACLPEPRTLLVGSPHVLATVLERNGHPKLSPRESELVARITGGDKSASVGMFFESVESMVSKAKAEIDSQLGRLDKDDRKMITDAASGAMKSIGDLDYAVKNIKHLTIEVEVGERIEARTQAECINPWKANKVVRIIKDFMASAPSGAAGLRSFTSTMPVVSGSTIEGTASFDTREFGDVFTAALTAQGF